ncbi:hypothetical protein GTQ48_09735 [Alteromonas genovensis]|uniref:Uncharacterized protein n=1 Tax=Alteromonas genovensis TaxID=471225 RepID=A0A6N9TER6_9ALTE|nr:hypothetical protein [Alteromonas genovensis]NDW15797.1 hypothetical protein [Alteromonas genovensis]
MDDIISELKRLKEEHMQEKKDDIYFRTIEKLLVIERQAIYGTLSQKNKKIELEIDKEMKNYRELKNVN